MCGIAGIVAYGEDAMSVDREELLDIREAMSMRGPDGHGLWMHDSERVGIAHRRLSIIDISDRAGQPMVSTNGKFVIAFNGEIYNYRELRRGLQTEGVKFRTESDTEVLLALYERHGEAMVHNLRGMYAFAIWDSHLHRLYAARDPFGIKPLYYSDDGRTFRFASQVKALVAGDAIRLTPEPAGHAGFFVLGYVPEPYTLYRQIRLLPAGTAITVPLRGRPILRRFYDVSGKIANAAPPKAPLSVEEQQELVASSVADSVKHHLVSDVPVGVFLSAGIDSNVLAATARSLAGPDIVAVTMAFRELQGTSQDEVPLAQAQSRNLHMKHAVSVVRAEEFYRDLPKIWASMDQPSIDGINSWLVSKAAANAGLKVCISGLGGDELFGGYPSYRQIPKLVSALSRSSIPRPLIALSRGLLKLLPERLVSPKYRQLFDYGRSVHRAYTLRRALFLPEELQKFLDPELVLEGLAQLDIDQTLKSTISGIESVHGAITALELKWYMSNQLLRDADWASMAHGLEVRTPFVDVRLFETLLPTLVSKRPPNKTQLAQTAAARIISGILTRPKTGFNTPVRRWLEDRFKAAGAYRGLRGWSRIVYSEFVPEISLLPDDPIPPRLAGSGPVLVYRIGQLGDSLVSLPTLRAIRERYSDRRVILLTDRHPERKGFVSAWEVIGPSKLCHGVMYYDVFADPIRKWSTYLRLVRKIRSVRPSAIINLAPRTRMKDTRRDELFFRLLCGVTEYLSLQPDPAVRHARGSTLNRVDPEWRRLTRVLSSSTIFEPYRPELPRWARHEASLAKAELPNSATKIVAFGPGSKMPAKRWSAERFLNVGRAILDGELSTAIVVLGGPEDRTLGDALCQAWGPRSLNLAGALSIYGSAALLADCDVYVGNDSGAMHLAGMMSVPCVAMFSARDLPGKWEPFGGGHHILRKDVPCWGCMLEVCDKNNLCLSEITVEDVLKKYDFLRALPNERNRRRDASALATGQTRLS
jgi:asparagine synthase (glutamine-hydrolysing)